LNEHRVTGSRPIEKVNRGKKVKRDQKRKGTEKNIDGRFSGGATGENRKKKPNSNEPLKLGGGNIGGGGKVPKRTNKAGERS